MLNDKDAAKINNDCSGSSGNSDSPRKMSTTVRIFSQGFTCSHFPDVGFTRASGTNNQFLSDW